MSLILVKFGCFLLIKIRSYQLTVSSMIILLRSDEEIVRPRVPLAACLEIFSAPEEVQDFYSSAINARTTAIKYSSQTVYLAFGLCEWLITCSGARVCEQNLARVPSRCFVCNHFPYKLNSEVAEGRFKFRFKPEEMIGDCHFSSVLMLIILEKYSICG